MLQSILLGHGRYDCYDCYLRVIPAGCRTGLDELFHQLFGQAAISTSVLTIGRASDPQLDGTQRGIVFLSWTGHTRDVVFLST